MKKKLLLLFSVIGSQAYVYCADDATQLKKMNLSMAKRRHSDPNSMISLDREDSPGRSGGAQRVRSHIGSYTPVTSPRVESLEKEVGPTLKHFHTALRDLDASKHIYLAKQILVFETLKKSKDALANERKTLNIQVYSIKQQEDGLRTELKILKDDIFSLIRAAQKMATDSLVTNCDFDSE